MLLKLSRLQNLHWKREPIVGSYAYNSVKLARKLAIYAWLGLFTRALQIQLQVSFMIWLRVKYNKLSLNNILAILINLGKQIDFLEI